MMMQIHFTFDCNVDQPSNIVKDLMAWIEFNGIEWQPQIHVGRLEYPNTFWLIGIQRFSIALQSEFCFVCDENMMQSWFCEEINNNAT